VALSAEREANALDHAQRADLESLDSGGLTPQREVERHVESRKAGSQRSRAGHDETN